MTEGHTGVPGPSAAFGRRRRLGALGIVAFALAGCLIERPDTADGESALPPDYAPGPGGIDGPGSNVIPADGHLQAFIDSVRSTERRRLEADAPPGVHRPSLTRLTVTPTDAPAVDFDDDVDGGDLMRLHIYRGRLAARFIVLEVIYYEGGQFLLVDERTGDAEPIDAMPLVSPDGARFVTTSLDLVAGHQPNRIAVYRLEPGGIVEEWAETPRDWGPSHAEWIDPANIRFRSNVIDTSAQPHSVSQSVLRLERTDGGWALRR
jgi:hypothetical protein